MPKISTPSAISFRFLFKTVEFSGAMQKHKGPFSEQEYINSSKRNNAKDVSAKITTTVSVIWR